MIEQPPSRIAPLEGGFNFRDIGGYLTQDGRRVRWGQVFRSGSMATLTPADQQHMAELGIRVICDFRSSRERAARPTNWSESHAVVHWNREHEGSVGELVAALRAPQASAASMRARMIDAYRTLPYEQADAYREVFTRIADSDLPLIFHCAAGKDRTGIAAALLLTTLEVPRHTVMEDYLLTERFFEEGCRLVFGEPSSRRHADIDPSVWEPMMRAEADYLEAMFATLDERHGGVPGYLRQVLGVDEPLIQRLRQQLLE